MVGDRPRTQSGLPRKAGTIAVGRRLGVPNQTLFARTWEGALMGHAWNSERSTAVLLATAVDTRCVAAEDKASDNVVRLEG
jgi:hypothetical protein